jgi:peptidyl-prolyl cis-trans isomerase SurA
MKSVRCALLKAVVVGPLLLLAVLAGCRRGGVGQEVLANVNGRGILASEVEKFYQVQMFEQDQRPSVEQEQMQRLMILRVLIDDEILLQRAETMGLLATDAEVEAKFNERKAPYSEEEFQKRLKERNLTTQDIKNDIRRELSLEKVFNKEVRAKIQVSDAEISKFYGQNRAGFNIPETRFHVAQIVVTGDPTAPIANLKNDKAKGEAEARRKIEGIAARLHAGDDFYRLAQELSEDANTARSNGDLGFIPASALDKADPLLKRAIVGLRPGETAGPIRAHDGWYILKLIEKQAPGQRQLNDPEVQQNIRNTLENRKAQLLREAYLDTARNQSKIINYYSRQILEAAGAGSK